MVNITKETREKNGVEVIFFHGKNLLSEKHIDQKLEHSDLREITSKYSLCLGKQRQELKIC